ncbi:hypothetical protein EV683_101211 [Crenobacter luteus]|nr:hypothetical protein EV683_101211 [Crenobacter luteus]
MQQDKHARRPWYKEPWPWLLALGPVAVVIAGVYTFKLAADTDDALVVDDYYKAGKEINLQLKRDEKAAALGLEAQALFAPDLRTVRLMVKGSAPTLALPDALTLRLLHPTLSERDATVIARRIAPGVYESPVKIAAAEHWYVRLEDPAAGWRIQGEWKPKAGPVAHLDPMLPASDAKR